MAADGKSLDQPRRQALKVAVCSLCSEIGFSHADESSLETLTEMLQSYLSELGRSAKSFAELACRTEPMLSDVVIAMVEMGSDVQSLPAYSRRINKTIFMPPVAAQPPPPTRTLQAGQKHPHPSYIPDHYPSFPDSHTYIKTLTHKPPVSEYQAIREKAATQKRDVEKALTKFIATTGDTEHLLQDDPLAFPLIACKSKSLPYLDALLPKDQDLDAQEDQEEGTSKMADKGLNKELPKPDDSTTSQEGLDTSMQSAKSGSDPNNTANETMDSENVIDNPYLRPIKMPSKLKGGKSKSKFW